MNKGVKEFSLGTVVVIVLLAGIIMLGVLGVKGCNNFNRSQARKDAENKVAITHIEIKNARERADIVHAEVAATQAEREKRVVEAKGLSEAQDIVNNTLTPLYVQHEAIQAQKSIADSGKNNTVIYVPSGTNGTPIITAGAQAGK